jgi:hypothetical protein
MGAIHESRANLTSYCLEAQKQLDMRYTSPPLPVDLKVANSADKPMGEQSKENGEDEAGSKAQTDMFRSMALAHGIIIDK